MMDAGSAGTYTAYGINRSLTVTPTEVVIRPLVFGRTAQIVPIQQISAINFRKAGPVWLPLSNGYIELAHAGHVYDAPNRVEFFKGHQGEFERALALINRFRYHLG